MITAYHRFSLSSKHRRFAMPIVADYEPGTIDRYIANWKQKGYDMDDNSLSPKTEGCPFRVYMDAFKEGSDDYEVVMTILKAIVDIMNAEIHKEKYEVKELVKEVHATDLPLYEDMQILKFNVSEVHTNEVKTVEAALYDDGYSAYYDLQEWRFKPGPPETPPEISYPLSPSPEASPEPEEPSISFDHWYKRDDDDLYFFGQMV
ncbi:uncharacterized protein LOC131000270 isoform X3 [Salvia miltiorrhiza]|uniref:uncharacterized protein LOC131000270 isoform X3 n=1 Tax=Salvia miltiorrhiza TaxID=226208 RepID=UPI0025AD86A2|nr:uncharacterized protein LOC131000270 isoform X3 [Salvia miltiorrhiza]